MTIAGGIMGALFHREKTGTATTVDVSLLSTGLWAMGQAIALSDLLGMPWGVPKGDNPTGNPLVNVYKTSDDRFVSLTCLQGGKRSEEHTSELQSLMRISYAVFCLTKNKS